MDVKELVATAKEHKATDIEGYKAFISGIFLAGVCIMLFGIEGGAIAFIATIIVINIFDKKDTDAKAQCRYLQKLYDARRKEIKDIAKSLKLLRAVPEMAGATMTEQEHVDSINENVADIKMILAAAKELDIVLDTRAV